MESKIPLAKVVREFLNERLRRGQECGDNSTFRESLQHEVNDKLGCDVKWTKISTAVSSWRNKKAVTPEAARNRPEGFSTPAQGAQAGLDLSVEPDSQGSATGRPQHDTQVPAQQHLGASLSQGVKQQRSVLLNFYCDEEGQQHADALYDALQQRHQNIEAVNGCELFGLKQLTSVQLHSGILLACMAAWMERNTHGPHSHLQIVPKVTAFRDHESAYATRIKEHIRFAAKHCEHWVKPSKEEVADFYGRLLLPYVWPEKPIGSWAAADVHLMHLSDQDAEQQWANFANDAAPPQAFVVSTPEACNILPDFFSGILSKKDRSKLQKVYPQTGSEGSWQRATLAALLIHDQDTLASLDSLVTKAEVELLVTLDFNCNKIRVFGRDPGMCIWTQGSPAECSFSIQLLAHAPRQPPGSGAKPIWTIAVDQEDRQSVTVQDLLDRAADGLQVAMDWSTCEVHSLCVTDTQKTCEQLVLEPTNGELRKGNILFDAICASLNQLAMSEDLLVLGVDAQDPSPERARIEFATEVVLTTLPPEASADAQAMPQDLDAVSSKLTIIPDVFDSQKQVAKRILDRVFILTGTAAPFHDRIDVWREASSKLLKNKFPKGVDFMVLTPRFNTLSQQTMQRVLRANLAADDDPTKVIQYSDRPNHKKQWASYRHRVFDQGDCLFLTIADECHWGPAAKKAHDQILNDYSDEPESNKETLLDRKNYLILLVSATPYNVLSRDSHLPYKSLVIKQPAEGNGLAGNQLLPVGCKVYDVFEERDGHWQRAPCESAPDAGAVEAEPVTITPQDMEALRSAGAVEELHVVDWFSKYDRHPKANNYRRLDAYLESTLRQLRRQVTSRTGLIQDQVFTELASKEKVASTGGVSQSDNTFTDDHVLICSYVIMLQFFRTFRWTRQDCVERGSLGNISNEQPPVSGLWSADKSECQERVQSTPYHDEFLAELDNFDQKHSSIRGLIPKLLQDMLDGVEGVDEDNQRKAMFSQWLKPQPGATAGNCDETYCIVESLLTVSYTTQTESAASSMPLWQRSDIDAMGSMKVIRVSDVKTGGRLFNTLLHAFLKFTARPGAKGPAWSGLVSKDNSSSHSKASWQLFAVIKDFSQDEASKKLEHNIPTWFRQRRLCSSHPCLKTPIQDVTLNDLVRQKAGLLYEDLYGVPCLLILCEKGRMGDTFPHTFDCLDMRLRQSDNHMTRVQELGRLCRYPSTSSDKVILPACDTDQLAGHQGSIDHLDLQLQKAFEFASNRPLTPVHAPIWHSTALSLSGTAVNVHAHISWMSALRQKPSRRTLANLKTLLERVQGLVDKFRIWASFVWDSEFALKTQVEAVVNAVRDWEDPASQAHKQAGKSSAAETKLQHNFVKGQVASINTAVIAWEEEIAKQQGQHSVPACFTEHKPLRVEVTKISQPFSADVVTPEELLDLLVNDERCDWTQQPSVKLARFDHRLPYAVIKSSPLLSNLQSKVWEQQIAQQPDDALHSYLDNMIVPTLLDAYVSPFRKLTGREVVDFRNNYRAKQPRNREKETVSYDTRPHDTHDRRILLAAECQIGKTGVYLALLQDLKQTLSSEAEVTVDIALPDLHTMPPPSTADVCDMPEDDDTVTVDYSKWFNDHDHPHGMRWQCPYYPDVSLWDGAQGQDMPKYEALHMAKYGKKVLLERIVRLVLSINLKRSSWLQTYVDATSRLEGELPLCEDARNKLAKLEDCHKTAQPPLHRLASGGKYTVLSQDLFVKVLNWDSRMHSCLNEFLQGKVLKSGGQEHLRIVSDEPLQLMMVGAVQKLVVHADSIGPLGIVQKLCWGDPGAAAVIPSGDKVTTSKEHPFLAFQPKALPEAPVCAVPAVLKARQLDVSLSNEVDVPDLFSVHGAQFHLSDSHELLLCQRELLQLNRGNCITKASSLPWTEDDKHTVQHWIFTPTSGRATGPRQAFLNWNKAMAPDAEYVRVLVVKQAELALYTKEMAALNSICKPLQQTMIMTLPKSLSLKQLTGLSPAYRNATAHCDPNDTLGIGYARLCIQLVARALQLQDVWMVDDNIQDCWQLDLSAQSLHQPPPGQGPTHGPLQSCSFDTIMRGIELQVSKTVVISAVSSPFTSGSLVRSWQPELSPRQSTAQTSTGSNVKTWFDYSGSHEHYAIIGPSRQPYRYKLVGATWPGGAGPPPFKITHSVYSFFLLNVAATMSAKPAVLWPARQYAEDIEFNHMCEDSKLAVVKCNRFFFHKANLQGVDLRQAAENPRVHIKPTLGPIWGGQHLDVQIQPEQHQTSVHSITVCGSRNVYCAQTPILSPELPLHMAPVASHQSNVVTGSVTVQCGTTQLEALQQYTYHGLWEWPPGTIVDNTTADKGSEQAEDAAQYWQRQHDYLTRGTHWLPTIGVPVHAERVFWSKCVPAALMKKQGCLLILDKPQLVLALHVLQGWAAQHAIDNTSKTEQFTCALFGKVADLHQQLMQEEHWSAKALCDNHGLHLVAAYSTNKPLKDRKSQGVEAYVPCKSILQPDQNNSCVHLGEGPYFVFHLKLTGGSTGSTQSKKKSKRT